MKKIIILATFLTIFTGLLQCFDFQNLFKENYKKNSLKSMLAFILMYNNWQNKDIAKFINLLETEQVINDETQIKDSSNIINEYLGNDIKILYNPKELIKAIIKKEIKKIQKILKVDSNELASKDIFGNTPLIWAVFVGNLEIVKLLVENFADINSQNDLNQSAYDIAVILKSNFPDYDQRIIDYLKSLQPTSCVIL